MSDFVVASLFLSTVSLFAAPPSVTNCEWSSYQNLLGCEYQKVNGDLPIKIVSSYDDYQYEDTFSMNEKDWNSGEINLSSDHYSQICRVIQNTSEAEKAIAKKCDPKNIPRGSLVHVIKTLPRRSNDQQPLILVRVISLSKKYTGLSEKITKSLIASGEMGIMPANHLKAPTPGQLFVDHTKTPLLIDHDKEGYHQFDCNGQTYLSFLEMDAHHENVKLYADGSFERKFLNLSCSDLNDLNFLETSTTASKAYKFLTAVNNTFDPSLPPAFSVTDFKWNEEGMVSLPYFEIDEENPEIEKISTIKDLEGVGPQNRYFTFNEPGKEFKNHMDRWGNAHAVCSIFALTQIWVSQVCASVAKDTAYCSPQFGDMAFHSPTVKSQKQRSLLGLSKDPIGHRTHSSGNCIDVRLLATNQFVHGFDVAKEDTNDVLTTTNLFLKTAFELGAVDLFYAHPNSSTSQFVRLKNDHADHVHLCFPLPEQREAGFHQSRVSVTSIREGQSIAPLRRVDLENLDPNLKIKSPYPIMPARRHPALDECYAL